MVTEGMLISAYCGRLGYVFAFKINNLTCLAGIKSCGHCVYCLCQFPCCKYSHSLIKRVPLGQCSIISVYFPMELWKECVIGTVFFPCYFLTES